MIFACDIYAMSFLYTCILYCVEITYHFIMYSYITVPLEGFFFWEGGGESPEKHLAVCNQPITSAAGMPGAFFTIPPPQENAPELRTNVALHSSSEIDTLIACLIAKIRKRQFEGRCSPM